MERNVYRFIVIPVIILIGIYIAGLLVQDFFELQDAPRKLFTGIGSVGGLAYYFRREIGRL